MKQLLSIGLILLLGCGCTTIFCPKEKCTTAVLPLSRGAAEYTLANKLIAVRCIPAGSGIVSGLEILPEKRQLIDPVKYTLSEDDLLPPRAFVTQSGVRELVWGMDLKTQSAFSATRCAVTNDGTAELELINRGYRNADATAVKTISVKPGESRVQLRLALTWHDKLSKQLAFWLNGIAQLGKDRDTVLLPVKGQTRLRGSRGVTLFPGDGVYADKTLEPQQVYAAPCRPWIGRVSPEKPGVLVLQINKNFVQDGCFLAWKHALNPLHTMELICGETRMEQGKTIVVEYELLYYPGMTSLRDAAGPYAVDLKGETLLLASAVPCPSGKLKLLQEDPAGKVCETGLLKFPKLRPGKPAELSLAGKLPKTGTLLLQMPDGVTLKLLPLVQPVKEGK